jgi:2-iminobutanoate/2-iminopropanoate deaminase
MTLYLADIADIAEVNAAYAEFFAGDPPARTTLQAAALVGGGRVCIDAIVVLP